MLSRIATLSLAGIAFIVGCHSTPTSIDDATPAATTTTTTTKANAVAVVTVTQVADLIKEKHAAVFDANDADTRKEYGVVPGAVLLTDHHSYPLTQLPASKSEKLVFYCGGTRCRASDAAAARAASAGYTDVNVMRGGIIGWKGAGMPIETAPQS